jgi:hypothetical protein
MLTKQIILVCAVYYLRLTMEYLGLLASRGVL